MKRAVAMARAFAQNPEQYFLTQPTTMVDPIIAGTGRLILRLR